MFKSRREKLSPVIHTITIWYHRKYFIEDAHKSKVILVLKVNPVRSEHTQLFRCSSSGLFWVTYFWCSVLFYWWDDEDVLFGSTDKKTTRYQCPADFVSFCHEPCSSTLTESLKNNRNELWLIKAPASFNPEWWVQSFPFHPLPYLCLSCVVKNAKSHSQMYFPTGSFHLYTFNLKLCIHFNLLNTLYFPIISQAESETRCDVVARIHIIKPHFRYSGYRKPHSYTSR